MKEEDEIYRNIAAFNNVGWIYKGNKKWLIKSGFRDEVEVGGRRGVGGWGVDSRRFDLSVYMKVFIRTEDEVGGSDPSKGRGLEGGHWLPHLRGGGGGSVQLDGHALIGPRGGG